MAESKTKYDRQLRIWGVHGQECLEKATICLLNCGPTGSETLKNLVLGGIGSITVVDGSKVEVGDLGNNFMLDEKAIGQSKAKCVCVFLQELNESVQVKFIEEKPEALIASNQMFFSQFSLVIATQLMEDSMTKLDRICREADVKLVFARSYGLTGFVHISLKEHTVIESNPDHFLDDLRLNNPWPELNRFVETIDINNPDPVVHKHIPHVIILIKISEEWRRAHGGSLPSSWDEKKEFKDCIKSKMISIDEENYNEALDASFKLFASPGISNDLQKIIEDSCTEVAFDSSDFWIMVAALKEFIANEGCGEVPLDGIIPDMTSSTELYVSLQKVYREKAEADFLVMEQKVKSILKRVGRDPNSISKQKIKSFSKNSRKLTVCRFRSIEDEFSTPKQLELHKYFADEDCSTAMGFFVLLRAADRFAATYSKFPGQFDGSMDEDISRLKAIVIGLLADLGCSGPASLTDELLTEMWRFGASELHVVASLIAGIASQEVIKLITGQFVPMMGTFVLDGINHRSQLLSL